MSTHNTTIFISYRRKESVLHTLLLHERLQRQFAGQVFMDQQGLEPGENFRVRIEQQLQGCRVMLAVIGPQWGSERLRNPRDWVRLEITTALQRGITVIPVLIDGAQMPEEAQLPEALHPLLDVHALDLDHERHFDEAANKLVGVLQRCLARSASSPVPMPASTSGSLGAPGPLAEGRDPPSAVTSNGTDPSLPGIDPTGSEAVCLVRPSWARDHGTDEFATPWADFEVGDVTQRMRWIAPGSFLMGCDPFDRCGGYEERPQHRVSLTKGFWLADTACTQALWHSVTGTDPSHFRGRNDAPVEQVSWNDVVTFFLSKLTNILGRYCDLPTEAEWEFSCRADSRTPYDFGNQIIADRINCDNHVSCTVPVKAFPANRWGLYQMHGNVWEWCRDARRAYTERTEVDPDGGQEGYLRALRGGAWFSPGDHTRSAYRTQDLRVRGTVSYGFRLVVREIISAPRRI